MNKRFNMGKVFPEAYQALDGLDQLATTAGIDPWITEMIRICASYINGCAYCVNSHTEDALKLGIHPGKIALVPVWRGAGAVFSEAERAILQLTGEVTLIYEHGLSDEAYQRCIALFGEKQTAALMMIIITINAWNRVGVALKMEPSLHK
jgi:AhpD family alkylhydroperoxidase